MPDASPSGLSLSASNAPTFRDEVFHRAADMIRRAGGFTAQQMATPEARAVIAETAGVLNQAIGSSLSHEVPDALRYALENNAFIFSGFKAYHSLREVGLSLTDSKGNIKPFEEFTKDVQAISQAYNRNYLYAEYNHAVAASQMAEKWQRWEQDGDRYDLQYRTAQDDRVREPHRLLHGTTLPPSDPFWERYLPPNGWNCRCTAVQVRKGKYPQSDPTLAMQRGDNSTASLAQQMFRYNPGKTLDLFPPKHPYYKAPKEVRPIVERQALDNTRHQAIHDMKTQHLPPYKERSTRYYTGHIVCGNTDREWLIKHIEQPYMLPIALDINNILPTLSNGEWEDIVPSHWSNSKEGRHVIGYTKYILYRTLRINGIEVEKKLLLKCEVRKEKGRRPCEFPYSIRETKE